MNKLNIYFRELRNDIISTSVYFLDKWSISLSNKLSNFNTSINAKFDFYNVRYRINKGDVLSASLTYSTQKEFYYEHLDYKNYFEQKPEEVQIHILNQIIDIVYDVQEKYDIKLKYEYKHLHSSSDYINKTKTIIIRMEKYSNN